MLGRGATLDVPVLQPFLQLFFSWVTSSFAQMASYEFIVRIVNNSITTTSGVVLLT